MLVKVNTSLVGADFSFRFGEEVEAEHFASLVGNGWQNLCDPIAGEPPAPIVASEEPRLELAVAQPVMETTSRRGRRK